MNTLKRRRTRFRIAATFVAVCLLAGLLVVDLPRLLRPATVTTLAPNGQTPATTTGGSATKQSWFSLNTPLLKTILNAVIPGLDDGSPANAGGSDRISAVFTLLAGATPRDPKSLLSLQIPLLAGVVLPQSGDDELPVVTPEPPPTTDPTTPPDGTDEPPETGEPETPTEPSTPPAPETVTPPDRDPVVSGKPVVAVYMTHARESFLPEVKKLNSRAVATDAFSRNMDVTTMTVGTELARVLSEKYKIGTVLSQTVHDTDTRGGAYVQSLKTMQSFLKSYPSLRLFCDIHRDSALHSATTVRIAGQETARILIVVGSNQTLKHPNWKKNYEFAKTLAATMERLYPGLLRGVKVQTGRYNQHVSPGALIFEVGGVDNTLAEEKRSVGLLAAVINDLIKNNKLPK